MGTRIFDWLGALLLLAVVGTITVDYFIADQGLSHVFLGILIAISLVTGVLYVYRVASATGKKP